jgi:hypothetical protein
MTSCIDCGFAGLGLAWHGLVWFNWACGLTELCDGLDEGPPGK